MTTRLALTSLLALLASVLGGCGGERQPPAAPPRPVTWFELAQTDPGTLARHTGSVESWKKELVGFEVGGRVDHVLEPGLNVDGRVQNLAGKVISQGEVVANLDATRYEIAKEQAQAKLKTANARATTVRREIENTLPKQLDEAREDLEFKEREFQRYQDLAEKGVESVARYDRARAEYRKSGARVHQLEALLTEKASELEALEATAEQFEDELHLAEKNLGDTRLYSPFSGQIAKVHVIPGGFVTPGQPVVTVQMMDPMKVQVAVSPQADAKIFLNDVVRIYVGSETEPIEGSVYLKATVADSATRTFMVTFLVRNRIMEVGIPTGAAASDALKIPFLTQPTTEEAGGKPPWFVEERALRRDAAGSYVWVTDGLTQSDLLESKPKTFKLKKVRLTMGEKILPILQLFSYREVTDLGELDPSRDLIAHGVPDDATEGQPAYFSRTMWLLRPGQLVHVDLRRGTLPPGLYVPMHCVAQSGDEHAIFKVEDGEDGTEIATRVPVRLAEVFGEFRRIEPLGGGTLAAGARIVLDGAHYLRDGEAINAFEEREVRP